MRSLRLLICGFAGIACWSAAMLFAAQGLRTDAPEAGGELSAPAQPAAQAAPVLEQKAVRAVSTDLFAAPFAAGDASLERIEPREAMGKDDIKPVQPVRLARPQTIEAGLLIFGVRTLRLAGVVATDRARICIDGMGSKWPCGAIARTQQRLLLRNRTVDCDLPSATWRGQKIASCQVGGIDMATWLAQNGWVEAEKGSELEALTTEARALRRGIFGDDPRQKPARP